MCLDGVGLRIELCAQTVDDSRGLCERPVSLVDQLLGNAGFVEACLQRGGVGLELLDDRLQPRPCARHGFGEFATASMAATVDRVNSAAAPPPSPTHVVPCHAWLVTADALVRARWIPDSAGSGEDGGPVPASAATSRRRAMKPAANAPATV
jgi:hypothetical protein